MTDRIALDGWNGWELDPDGPALTYAPYGYTIRLDQMLTSSGILFWICQLAGKVWKPGHVEGFVQAIDAIYDPQTYMRNDRSFSSEEIRDRVAEFVANPNL